MASCAMLQVVVMEQRLWLVMDQRGWGCWEGATRALAGEGWESCKGA